MELKVCACAIAFSEGLRAEKEDDWRLEGKWKEPLIEKKIPVVKISVGKYRVEC